jgi:hypothetical protein
VEINIKLPAVKLGTVEAENLRVAPADTGLAQLMDEVCERKRKEFTLESLAEAKPVRDVRAMFREWGIDPSKYRPSSEALLRRVVQGKGLIAFQISWTSEISGQSKQDAHSVVTTGREFRSPSNFATAFPARAMKASANKHGILTAVRCSPIPRAHSAAR